MKRVLVVDDTKNIRNLLTKCLELDGFQVVSASDGKSALEILSKESFDLIFLDIKMPLLSGTEVLKKLRETGISVPVIIITAYATVKNAVDCTQLGAVAYLQKPFTAEKIRGVIRELQIAVEKNDDPYREIESLIDRNNFSEAETKLLKLLPESLLDPKLYQLLGKVTGALGKKEESLKYSSLYRTLKSQETAD